MTTNIDRAVEVIFRARIDAPPSIATEDFIARALHEAGLLAPDLPEPAWEHTTIWVVDDLEIEAIGDFVHLEWLDGMDDMRGATTRSLKLDRRMILALLAAADHAEGVGRADS